MKTSIPHALAFARIIHRHQKRHGGEDYITHPIEVSKILESAGMPDEYLQIALLHDVLEDSHFPAEELRNIFGSFVAQGVQFLTKDSYPTKQERIQHYLEKLGKGTHWNESVYLVKMADVMHNLETLDCLSTQKQTVQIAEVQDWYLPFFYKNIYCVSPRYHLFCLQSIGKIRILCKEIDACIKSDSVVV